MNEPLARHPATLGDACRIDRALGGGGIRRAFPAEERELGRRGVIRVLPPEIGAGVNAQRFRRDMRLAASWPHAHIVPLVTAGSAGDLVLP